MFFSVDEVERLRRGAAIAFSLEVDLKAEKRVNDELRKDVHELRLEVVSLQAKHSMVSCDASILGDAFYDPHDSRADLFH